MSHWPALFSWLSKYLPTLDLRTPKKPSRGESEGPVALVLLLLLLLWI